jgi:hypothetical protein
LIIEGAIEKDIMHLKLICKKCFDFKEQNFIFENQIKGSVSGFDWDGSP